MKIAASSVDGNDVWAVRAAAYEAIEHARSGNGPAFVEAHTYRYNDHIGRSRRLPPRGRDGAMACSRPTAGSRRDFEATFTPPSRNWT